MELFILLLIIWAWWSTQGGEEKKKTSTGPKWRFVFKSKRTPPIEISAPTEGLAVKLFMAIPGPYQGNPADVLRIEPVV